MFLYHHGLSYMALSLHSLLLFLLYISSCAVWCCLLPRRPHHPSSTTASCEVWSGCFCPSSCRAWTQRRWSSWALTVWTCPAHTVPWLPWVSCSPACTQVWLERKAGHISASSLILTHLLTPTHKNRLTLDAYPTNKVHSSWVLSMKWLRSVLCERFNFVLVKWSENTI